MPFVISESFNKDADQLRSDCFVRDPLTGNSVKATAIWDTGASCSCISPSIASHLSLPVIASATSSTANGTVKTTRHVVDIAIGNVVFPRRDVSALKIPDGVVLIGMDIIGLGKFSVQNMDVEGKTKKVLTLELP